MSNPNCPECKSNANVILVKRVKKAGAIIGRTAGAVTAYKKTSSFIPKITKSVVPLGLTTVLRGLITGMFIGSALGECIDEKVLSIY